ncbi:hypothetical protein PAXRUDRAFT_830785 [Paxillus rubicundulus Ve08.2h10]|uniref:Unplaced genomic scaffold scaffold_557, whole genome shotgun sequence n=1 Tax=Paxillus rubicundulus Ve08.2h10 TaxID=930991 RepID=A0A0D0DK45_9AGAM|nr:hypothetical protein PAXRUDRAFT_830785 [Paxillus rubicundulus Ve08.2h10]
MVCRSPARVMVAIAVKLIGWLTRILTTFAIPPSGDAIRRALSILLRIYKSVTKPTATDSTRASTTPSLLQSQVYHASSTPASASSSQVNIQIVRSSEDGSGAISTSPTNAVGYVQHAQINQDDHAIQAVPTPPEDGSDATLATSNTVGYVQPDSDHHAPPSRAQARPTSRLLPPADPQGSNNSMLNAPPLSIDPASTSHSSLQSAPGGSSTRILRPGAPREIMKKRYSQRIKVEGRDTERVLNPGDMNYDEGAIHGWVRCTQPEGSSYFLNPTKRITTDIDLSKRQILEWVDRVTNGLLQSAGRLFTMHDETELVIGLLDDGHEKRECVYYFVDHRRQLLFWVHAYKLSNIFANVKGVTKFSHMKYAVETQYWTHLELYPNQRKLKAEHHAELRGILIHASTETLTSKASIAPFELDELGRMLDLVDKAEASIDKEQVHAVYIVARLMRLFTSSRFVNFYGQPEARLNVDQSVYTKLRGQDETPSLLIRISDLLLFGGPSAHATELQRVWVDRTVNFPRWKGFVSKLSNEWAGFTIYSTVMLAVDVSFLTIPALAPKPVTATTTSMQDASNTSTYLSIITVVGSLVVSVQLSNGIRGQGTSSAEEAAEAMMWWTKSILGTDALAIMYSLPFALLIWGMIFFVLALALVVFGSGDDVIIGLTAPAAIIVGLLTVWPSWGHRGKYQAMHELWMQGLRSVKWPRVPRRTDSGHV